jgi:hypothetical protein
MRSASEQQPDQQLMKSLEGRLGELFTPAPPPPSGAAQATVSVGAKAPLLKLVVGSVVLGGAAAILLSLPAGSSPSAGVEPRDTGLAETPAVLSAPVETRSQDEQPITPASSLESTEDTQASRIEPINEQPPRRNARAEGLGTLDRDRRQPPAPVVVEAPRREAEAYSTIAEEARLLRQARAALASSPATAIELTEQHRARFSSGLLIQEREMIAIEALTRAGRRDQARRRAEAFRERYPSSSYRP